MGVRKEGSGKSRPKMNVQGVVTTVRGAAAGLTEHACTSTRGAGSSGDVGDEDSDSELQEVYVQAYACQVFRDDAAAGAVDGGAHLRPLALPQDPDGEPLMLDRFDARWMLDMTDFNKGSGAKVPAKLQAEEDEADSLRYAGLPTGDHSVEVGGLGKFAPQGSYANERNRGGLGDDEEEEEEPEVYGYYGRTASPPPTSRGAWSATPAPQHSVNNGSVTASQAGALSSGAVAVGVAESSEGGASKGEEEEEEEAFVPDFGVPQGVAVPPTFRQHMMIVGTARTAVRSPQLEVLLRLKQASNVAFSFLSVEDPVHSYYVFLKSWGESALAAEYTRQQRLQKERGEARQRDEKERQGSRDQEAAAKASGPLPPLSPAEKSDSSDDGPNLLGGAYDSSGDEDDARDPVAKSAAVRTTTSSAAPGKTGGGMSPPTLPLAVRAGARREGFAGGVVGDGQKASVDASAVPDEAKRVVVDKMVGFVARNGAAFEDRVREREKANPAFDFLLPSNRFHAYYKARLASAKGETPAVSGARSSVGESNGQHTRNSIASASQQAQTAATSSAVGAARSGSPSGGRSGVRDQAGGNAVNSASIVAGGSITLKPSASSLTSSVGAASDVPSTPYLAEDARGEGHDEAPSVGSAASTAARARLETARSRDGPAGFGHDSTATADRNSSGDAAPTTTKSVCKENMTGVMPSGGSSSDENGDANEDAVGQSIPAAERFMSEHERGGNGGSLVVEDAMLPLSVVSQEDESAGGAVLADEDAETRRANRLKRARLMKGHYKLAVMHHSTEQESATDGGGQQGAAIEDLGTGGEAAAAEGSEDDDDDSADGLSDFDVASDSDDGSDDGDAGDDRASGGSEAGSAGSQKQAGGDNIRTAVIREDGGRRAYRADTVKYSRHDDRGRNGLSERKRNTDRSGGRRNDPSSATRRRSRSRSYSRERERGGPHGRTRDRDRSRKESTGVGRRGQRENARDSSRTDKAGESRLRRRASPDRHSQDRRRHSTAAEDSRRRVDSAAAVRDSSSRRDKNGDSSRRSSGANGESSKSSRSTDDRGGRGEGRSGARIADSGQRTKESRSDRSGGSSRTGTKDGRRVEHEYRDRKRGNRGNRSGERGESREPGGRSDKRSRRR